MSSSFSKSSLKYKAEERNTFFDNFLKEKDLAMQSLDFILEAEKLLYEEENNIQKNKEDKKKKKKKTNLKDSALYDSNIIIIQTLSDFENEPTQIEKEIGKLEKLLSDK